MRNYRLKLMILEKFKSQWRFSLAVNLHESDVSRVIAGRRLLSKKDQIKWAELLGCSVNEVFQNAKTDP